MKSLILSVLLSSVVCLSCTHKRQQSQPEGPAITGGNDTVTNIQTGIPQNAIRTQEVGDYWRQQGQDFLVSKQLDITLTDFNQINEIVSRIDTKGVHNMRIGELENKDMLAYHQKGKIEALKAAQKKAAYLVEALGKRLGGVIRIVEQESGNAFRFAQSNVLSSDAASFDNFRTIKKNYSMQVRFEITD